VNEFDVVVVGGGQAALAVGFYLRRSGLSYVMLDDQDGPGGAWTHTWKSLRLFSPSQWSSLPGWMMPRTDNEYPSRNDVIAYLTEYERRYELPVLRPVHVDRVSRSTDGTGFLVTGHTGDTQRSWKARAVVSATGSWANPFVPDIPGRAAFTGVQLHTAHYSGIDPFIGRSVIVVGAGNSGAQIVAELSEVATVTWATLAPPVFLPDDVDGRYLFEQATARYKAIQEGRAPDPPRSLGDVVAVPAVRAARERGALVSRRMFGRFTPTGVEWPDGSESRVDAVIWATGFRAALSHLAPLGIIGADGRVSLKGTRLADGSPLWLVGYGEWTGYASATLIGVGRSARATIDEVIATLRAGELDPEPPHSVSDS
jgi:putative flavoprotein involved in K+ transport